MLVFFIKPRQKKNVKSKERGCSSCCRNENGGFREKVSDFSLDLRQIRPSAVFGTRRRTALHGEGFAWVLDLGSFLKLLEVEDLSYLGFILYLSVFTMFELIEAVNGRLIGPKWPFDRSQNLGPNCENFSKPLNT